MKKKSKTCEKKEFNVAVKKYNMKKPHHYWQGFNPRKQL